MVHFNTINFDKSGFKFRIPIVHVTNYIIVSQQWTCKTITLLGSFFFFFTISRFVHIYSKLILEQHVILAQGPIANLLCIFPIQILLTLQVKQCLIPDSKLEQITHLWNLPQSIDRTTHKKKALNQHPKRLIDRTKHKNS